MSKVHAVAANLHQHQGYPLHANTQSRSSFASQCQDLNLSQPPGQPSRVMVLCTHYRTFLLLWYKPLSLQKFLKIIILKCISILNKSISKSLLQGIV